MESRTMYNDGSRELQNLFESEKLATRMEETIVRSRFNAEDRLFIEQQGFFFLATADDEGSPDCSFKAGPSGFLRVLDETTLIFPSYDGNGMFKSLGNLRVNHRVGLIFLDFESPRRLRVNGTATVAPDDALLSEFAGAQLIVWVHPTHIFPNCPRYIPQMKVVKPSPFLPTDGVQPPTPNWKLRPEFNDVLAPGDPARSTPKND